MTTAICIGEAVEDWREVFVPIKGQRCPLKSWQPVEIGGVRVRIDESGRIRREQRESADERWITLDKIESIAFNESTSDDLERVRQAREAELSRVLYDLDARHREQVRAAIIHYGSVAAIPESFWDRVKKEIEDETAGVILLSMMAGDEWTTGQLQSQQVRVEHEQAVAGYAILAAQDAQAMADSTTTTIRNRLERKVADARLDVSQGGIGTLTGEGVRGVISDVYTPQRRETIVADLTTGALTSGQRGAVDRARGGEGAETISGQRTQLDLIWRTELDNLVCPRCRPLEGSTEEVWGLVFPDGPGPEAHPNCRCYLQPRAVVEIATESIRQSDETSEPIIGLHNSATLPTYRSRGGEKNADIREIIHRLPNGKYRLYSHDGKNLGTFDSLDAAKKHENEVNYFKSKEA